MKAGILRSTIVALALLGASIAGGASAKSIAADLLAKVTNADDRKALGDISISDDGFTLPKLNGQYLVTVRGYAAGIGAGDGGKSSAYLRLFVDGGRVAYRRDEKFNKYSLEASYTFVSSSTKTIPVRIEHDALSGSETSYGVDIVEIKPF